MSLEGIRGGEEVRNLSGWRNILLAGLATSIDALAVGAAQTLGGCSLRDSLPLAAGVLLITFGSVVAGIRGGSAIGRKTGRWAEIVGGIVLIIIGVTVLL